MVIAVIYCGYVFVTFPLISDAAGGNTGGVNPGGNGSVTQLQNPLNVTSIQKLVARILQIVVAIGAPVVIFFLVYAGFLFVTARGNETTLARAKQAIFWTIIGGLILLGAQTLSQVICGTINQVTGQQTCK